MRHPFFSWGQKSLFYTVAAFCMALVCRVQAVQSTDSDAMFQAANDAFTKADYGEAAYLFRELADESLAPGALHNLGNVEWRVGRPGHAILAWERALTLAPTNRNTLANLRFARLTNQLEEPQRPWYEQYSLWLPAGIWIAVASIGLWGGIAMLCLPRIFQRMRSAWSQAFAAIALTAFLLTLPALLGLWKRQHTGVVVTDDASLLLTPTRTGEILVKPAAGELAQVEKVRGNYYYVRASQDRAGWIHTRDFALIWEK